jgi:hypothetical protein
VEFISDVFESGGCTLRVVEEGAKIFVMVNNVNRGVSVGEGRKSECTVREQLSFGDVDATTTSIFIQGEAVVDVWACGGDMRNAQIICKSKGAVNCRRGTRRRIDRLQWELSVSGEGMKERCNGKWVKEGRKRAALEDALDDVFEVPTKVGVVTELNGGAGL